MLNVGSSWIKPPYERFYIVFTIQMGWGLTTQGVGLSRKTSPAAERKSRCSPLQTLHKYLHFYPWNQLFNHPNVGNYAVHGVFGYSIYFYNFDSWTWYMSRPQSFITESGTPLEEPERCWTLPKSANLFLDSWFDSLSFWAIHQRSAWHVQNDQRLSRRELH